MKEKFMQHITSSEITSESIYTNRRIFLKALTATASLAGTATLSKENSIPDKNYSIPKFTRNKQYSLQESSNTYNDATTYNNFYEFGTDKSDPAAYSKGFKSKPWTVEISGEAEIRGKFTIEDILKPHPLEERIYRFRCVEAWSMVIPWMGFSLADLINRFRPTANAKYVVFTTLHDPIQMPGQREKILDWPYVEGLRIDEAMNPLTLMVVGLYGRWLPNQNGAPLRLIVPWKYGFKSIKSIVGIRFTEKQPRTSWNIAAPEEYGFYANVNPDVDHPRWSQAKERRIGGNYLSPRIQTLPYNGYATEVSALYRNMNLSRYF
ncbi:MAG: protein-methionine-sulfoxide reductase catalytic subunit MsrP [Gammaproteobacteria bacterium]|nr:protein-methionine-sulfoxide reductase catalytic subunit MsrP [Gammaproteobacteria bacterium]